MKKQQMVGLVVLIALIIVVALVSSGRLQLSPALSASSTPKCQLGPLTDCINGCWQTYSDRIEDINDAYRDHKSLCCADAGSACSWNENSSMCLSAKNDSNLCHDPDYESCTDNFDYLGLIEQAKKDRDACIKGCQGQFCSGGAVNQQVQLSPSDSALATSITPPTSRLQCGDYCGNPESGNCPTKCPCAYYKECAWCRPIWLWRR